MASSIQFRYNKVVSKTHMGMRRFLLTQPFHVYMDRSIQIIQKRKSSNVQNGAQSHICP